MFQKWVVYGMDSDLHYMNRIARIKKIAETFGGCASSRHNHQEKSIPTANDFSLLAALK